MVNLRGLVRLRVTISLLKMRWIGVMLSRALWSLMRLRKWVLASRG